MLCTAWSDNCEQSCPCTCIIENIGYYQKSLTTIYRKASQCRNNVSYTETLVYSTHAPANQTEEL